MERKKKKNQIKHNALEKEKQSFFFFRKTKFTNLTDNPLTNERKRKKKNNQSSHASEECVALSFKIQRAYFTSLKQQTGHEQLFGPPCV